MTDWTWNESKGAWLHYSEAEDASLVVAGLCEFPNALLCAAALSLIENARNVKAGIAEYLIGTPIQVHSGDGRVSVVVHPERPSNIMIVNIELRDLAEPNSHVSVVTEYPDPYYLYDVTLDGTSIVGVRGRLVENATSRRTARALDRTGITIFR